jgi:hypothetical protein
MVLQRPKKKETTKDISNIVIIISLLWLIVALIVIVGFDLIGPLSSFFTPGGVGDTAGIGAATMTVRVPLILGSFTLAYGIGMKLENKMVAAIIALFLGSLIAIVCMFILGTLYFVVNY